MRQSHAIVAGGLLLGLVSCAQPERSSGPSEPPAADPETPIGRPVGRSEHPKAGRFTYRLLGVDRARGGTTVDLELRNGTSRNYDSVEVRVITYGPRGQTETVRVPLGAIRRGRVEPFRAHLPELPYEVKDVGLELILTSP